MRQKRIKENGRSTAATTGAKRQKVNKASNCQELLLPFLKPRQRDESHSRPHPEKSLVAAVSTPEEGVICDEIVSDDSPGHPVGHASTKSSEEPKTHGASLARGRPRFVLKDLALETRDSRPLGNKSSFPKPWCDKYSPESVSELGVHKKKVQEVQYWFHQSFDGEAGPNLLILKGPAGAGKTSTVRAVARTLGCPVIEWENPIQRALSRNGAAGSMNFDEFLESNIRYSPLETSSEERTSPTIAHTRKCVALIEEQPALASSQAWALQSFRRSLLAYLASRPRSPGEKDAFVSKSAVVVIITEVTAGPTEDTSLTAVKLLGDEIMQHPKTRLVEFNPVAPTILLKALELTLKKAAPTFSERKKIQSSLLKTLAQTGDLRSAIGALELYFAGLSSSSSKYPEKTATDAQSEGMISGTIPLPGTAYVRDSNIDLFHAIGKVVYNKQEATPSSQKQGDAPVSNFDDYLSSGVTANRLFQDLTVDADLFVAALHENYMPSCDPQNFPTCFESCAAAISEADQWIGKGLKSLSATMLSSEKLQAQEFGFHFAVRSLLCSLPVNARRQIANSDSSRSFKARANPYKMYYPQSLGLRRLEVQNRDSISLLQSLLRQDNSTRPPFEGVGSGSSLHGPYPLVSGLELSGRDIDASVSFTHLRAATLATEVLPFMRQLVRFDNILSAVRCGDVGSQTDEAQENAANSRNQTSKLVTASIDSPAIGAQTLPRDSTDHFGASGRAGHDRLFLAEDDIEES